MRSIADILAQLGDAACEIGIVVDAGDLPSSAPSSVIDVRTNNPVILREGAILSAEVWDTLRTEL